MADLVKKYGGQNRGENAGIVQIEEQGKYDGGPGGDLYPETAQIAAM